MATTKKGLKVARLIGVALAVILAASGFVCRKELRNLYLFWREFESLGENAQGYSEYRHRQTGILFVSLPAGTFSMGTSEEQAKRVVAEFGDQTREELAPEQPQHEVRLSPFLIAKYEVTQAGWRRVMGEEPARFKGDSLPVERVSWVECKEFAAKTGLSLPTEAQWEYACRAGTNGHFAGTGKLDDMGWCKDNSGSTTHAVGQKQPNAFGLYDMHGNVWEWCEDAFDEFSSGYRAIRGGSWFVAAQHCRSAFRYADPPSNHLHSLGFRPTWSSR